MRELGTSTWATEIRTTLFGFGFGAVWVSQGVGNQAKVIREFKQRLVDYSSQRWRDRISTSERLELYRELNQTLDYEGSLSWLRPKIYRDEIVRFRLIIYHLCCNKYR